MPEARVCPDCGSEIPADAPEGLCPRCLAGLASDSSALTDASEAGAVITLADPQPLEDCGTIIGRYKLLQRIGEGGMGVVYMAEQTEPVRRMVALKIIKLGMDTKEVIARFEAERQALAMMDHPNIAKVLDAGATDTGRPYFVMELVRGLPITRYCDEARLDTRERLELFVKVCLAVQHAHQKGLIHRDLKPSNVMVTLQDDRANPKVIDFGVAKATNQRLTEKTMFTRYGQFIGTPEYMSPEQAALGEFDIDTRSDIFALGVLLYELLTGRTPYEPRTLRGVAYDEVRRIICEEEPAKPSTAVSTMDAVMLGSAASRRRVAPPRLQHLIRGDLDWITLMCLEKDRARRYDTAKGLAADIQRHLEGRPVCASPPSVTYRLKRTVMRNKLAVASATAVAASLIISLVVSVIALRLTANSSQANRLVNSGFETDAVLGAMGVPLLTGWKSFGSGSLETACAPDFPARTGIGSLLLIGPGSFTVPAVDQTFFARPGEIWDFQGYMLTLDSITSASSGQLKLIFSDVHGNQLPVGAENTIIGTPDPPPWPGVLALPKLDAGSTTGEWIFAQAQVVAPAGAVAVHCAVQNVDETSQRIFFDDLQVTDMGGNMNIGIVSFAPVVASVLLLLVTVGAWFWARHLITHGSAHEGVGRG